MVEVARPAVNASSHSLHLNEATSGLCSRSVSGLELKSARERQDESAAAGAEPKMKFVGKHSKDKIVSVYLQKRTIYENEKDHKVETLSGLVRVSQLHAERILEKDHGIY